MEYTSPAVVHSDGLVRYVREVLSYQSDSHPTQDEQCRCTWDYTPSPLPSETKV